MLLFSDSVIRIAETDWKTRLDVPRSSRVREIAASICPAPFSTADYELIRNFIKVAIMDFLTLYVCKTIKY